MAGKKSRKRHKENSKKSHSKTDVVEESFSAEGKKPKLQEEASNERLEVLVAGIDEEKYVPPFTRNPKKTSKTKRSSSTSTRKTTRSVEEEEEHTYIDVVALENEDFGGNRDKQQTSTVATQVATEEILTAEECTLPPSPELSAIQDNALVIVRLVVGDVIDLVYNKIEQCKERKALEESEEMISNCGKSELQSLLPDAAIDRKIPEKTVPEYDSGGILSDVGIETRTSDMMATRCEEVHNVNVIFTTAELGRIHSLPTEETTIIGETLESTSLDETTVTGCGKGDNIVPNVELETISSGKTKEDSITDVILEASRLDKTIIHCETSASESAGEDFIMGTTEMATLEDVVDRSPNAAMETITQSDSNLGLPDEHCVVDKDLEIKDVNNGAMETKDKIITDAIDDTSDALIPKIEMMVDKDLELKKEHHEDQNYQENIAFEAKDKSITEFMDTSEAPIPKEEMTVSSNSCVTSGSEVIQAINTTPTVNMDTSTTTSTANGLDQSEKEDREGDITKRPVTPVEYLEVDDKADTCLLITEVSNVCDVNDSVSGDIYLCTTENSPDLDQKVPGDNAPIAVLPTVCDNKPEPDCPLLEPVGDVLDDEYLMDCTDSQLAHLDSLDIKPSHIEKKSMYQPASNREETECTSHEAAVCDVDTLTDSGMMKGLISELSSLNAFIMGVWRDLETLKKQRQARQKSCKGKRTK